MVRAHISKAIFITNILHQNDLPPEIATIISCQIIQSSIQSAQSRLYAELVANISRKKSIIINDPMIMLHTYYKLPNKGIKWIKIHPELSKGRKVISITFYDFSMIATNITHLHEILRYVATVHFDSRIYCGRKFIEINY